MIVSSRSSSLPRSRRPEALAAQQRIDPAQVVGWGVDADPKNDPAYPMRNSTGESSGGLNWERPPLQRQSVEILRSTEHNRRPAVFGTSTPPSGLSGALRRRAFRKSEGKWGHWLMLLAADRINMVEGIGQDLKGGRVPNILGEMGIRSELKHNLPGFIGKMAVTGAVLTLAYALVRPKSPPPQQGGHRSRVARRRR